MTAPPCLAIFLPALYPSRDELAATVAQALAVYARTRLRVRVVWRDDGGAVVWEETHGRQNPRG
jgi:hypothetical protein